MPRKLARETLGFPVESTLRVIGGRRKVLVLNVLPKGTRRFAELHRALSGISHRFCTPCTTGAKSLNALSGERLHALQMKLR